jgi:diguanylate cyclase (GGDEF)-like protein
MISDAHILVVDDIRTNRHYLVRHLKKKGYEHILEAEDGQVALDILEAEWIDIVLLDIMMPNVDGYEVLKRMKSGKRWRDIPVIMITALDEIESAVQCIEDGAEDYLPKPFNPILLQARVNASLEKKRLLDVEREYLRFYDAGTGLPNQELLTNRLTGEIARWKNFPELCALLVIRLDRYEILQNSLGDASAEAFFNAQAIRLKSVIPKGAFLSRLSNQEFALLVYRMNHVSEGSQVAKRLSDVLEAPISIDGHDISGRIRIGMAFSSTNYQSAQDMIRDASLAASSADQSTGFQVFDRGMHEEAMRRLVLEPELQRAIDGDQLRLYYQPIVNLSNGRTEGLEALVRWLHPEKGMVRPDHFITLAEETGLIVPIGRWVLQEGCRQLSQWQRELPGREKLTVSVNVSARQFEDPDFMGSLHAALESTELQGECLKLELTETGVIDSPERVDSFLKQALEMGIVASLDDFGTGYCSLSYLHQFPFQVLKIDQSFVRGIDQAKKNRSIVESTVVLAHRLGMNVVAEGVESEAEKEILAGIGCEYGQGAFFAMPMSADDTDAHLARQRPLT